MSAGSAYSKTAGCQAGGRGAGPLSLEEEQSGSLGAAQRLNSALGRCLVGGRLGQCRGSARSARHPLLPAPCARRLIRIPVQAGREASRQWASRWEAGWAFPGSSAGLKVPVPGGGGWSCTDWQWLSGGGPCSAQGLGQPHRPLSPLPLLACSSRGPPTVCSCGPSPPAAYCQGHWP